MYKAMSFYKRNDTPNFCHQTEFIPNQLVPLIVSPLPFSSELVRHAVLFAYFFK